MKGTKKWFVRGVSVVLVALASANSKSYAAERIVVANCGECTPLSECPSEEVMSYICTHWEDENEAPCPSNRPGCAVGFGSCTTARIVCNPGEA